MEATFVRRLSSEPALTWRPALAGAIGAWTLGFAAPLYLALRGGGYEVVLRDQVGVALWWIVLLGVLLGVLAGARPSRAQALAIEALVLFAVWTGLGALWSQNSEHTVAELSRLSAYAAVLTLGVLSVRAGSLRWLAGGVASAIAAVALLALLSRLHPAWFPANETAAFLPESRGRLNYPLNYWNGLAAFTALGVPLVLHFAAGSRRLGLRALSAGALPVMAATMYLTFSRGGVLEVAAALLVYLAFTPGRTWRLLILAVCAAGGALLIAAIHERPDVDHGLLASAAARHGGNELIAVAAVVCAAVALLTVALGLLERNATRPAFLTSLLRPRRWPWLAAAAIAIALFLAAGGPHALSHAWQDFKNPALQVASSQENSEARLTAVSGNGRYQYWTSALDAFTSHPLGGIGAGTFQFWWAAHGSIYSYVVNAHSLYFETLAETGLPGIVLLLALLGALLGGVVFRLRRSAGADRALLAAVLGAGAAFCVAAGVDWVWQIPAIPVAFLLLTGAAAARTGDPPRRRAPAGGRALAARRAGWSALALLGTAAILVPMASAVSLRESQDHARQGQLAPALRDARTAAAWQPHASSPELQQALVLELSHDYAAGAGAARKAVRDAPTSWSAWLVLSRIEAENGRPRAAVAAYRRARSLDPRDPLFSSP